MTKKVKAAAYAAWLISLDLIYAVGSLRPLNTIKIGRLRKLTRSLMPLWSLSCCDLRDSLVVQVANALITTADSESSELDDLQKRSRKLVWGGRKLDFSKERLRAGKYLLLVGLATWLRTFWFSGNTKRKTTALIKNLPPFSHLATKQMSEKIKMYLKIIK